jgi:hypothetical protein
VCECGQKKEKKERKKKKGCANPKPKAGEGGLSVNNDIKAAWYTYLTGIRIASM